MSDQGPQLHLVPAVEVQKEDQPTETAPVPPRAGTLKTLWQDYWGFGITALVVACAIAITAWTGGFRQKVPPNPRMQAACDNFNPLCGGD